MPPHSGAANRPRQLADLPDGLVLDGEIVAFNDEGVPHWPLVGRRLLHRDDSIPLVLVIFDLLRQEGDDLTRRPYAERRERLEALELESACWRTPEVFDDGHAFFEAVCAHGLEGIVAKRLSGMYRPGRRGSWVKIKTAYWRREPEGGGVPPLARPRMSFTVRGSTRISGW